MNKPRFFKTQNDFRKWLVKNHAEKSELIVGFYKKSTGKKSIVWTESVDEALSFGWIDGIRRSLGEESYTIRFTPRRKGSIWSAVNIKRAGELKKLGLMYPAGLKEFEGRDLKKANLYSFERKNVKLSTAYRKKFKQNKEAWEFFNSKPPSYQTPALWWVISAKQEATRLKRLDTLIHDSENGRTIKHLTRK